MIFRIYRRPRSSAPLWIDPPLLQTAGSTRSSSTATASQMRVVDDKVTLEDPQGPRLDCQIIQPSQQAASKLPDAIIRR